MADPTMDFTPQLRALMTPAEISSLAQLSRISGVPRSQLTQLRQGKVERIPLGSFIALAKALKVSLAKILETFGAIAPKPDNEAGSEQQWQQSSLDILESLILQLPTAAFAAQNNPTAPAIRLLPLLNPLNQLLIHWNVATIGEVGGSMEFNPQYHQWIGNSPIPDPGTPVKIRYVGYLHGDRLLHRAKVGPL